MTAAAFALGTIAAAIYLPSRIDMARRNRHARPARADHWNALIQQALEAGPLDEDTPVYDRLVCDEIAKAEGWTS